MISSVIAKLDGAQVALDQTIGEIESRPDMDVGDLVDNRLLPVTIEAEKSGAMEDATRWLQSLDGVEFVDVVFVHFEDDDQ